MIFASVRVMRVPFECAHPDAAAHAMLNLMPLYPISGYSRISNLFDDLSATFCQSLSSWHDAMQLYIIAIAYYLHFCPHHSKCLSGRTSFKSGLFWGAPFLTRANQQL